MNRPLRDENTVRTSYGVLAFKSEPNTWSWSDQIAVGSKGTEWDGLEIIKQEIIWIR